MAKREKQTHTNLAHFDARNSVRGRFLRYCHGRIRHMAARQVLTVAGGIAIAWVLSVEMGLAIAGLIFGGELLDLVVLKWILRQHARGGDVFHFRFLAMLSAAFQGATIAVAMLATVILAPTEAWFFVMAFAAGALWDVGMHRYVFPGGAMARTTVLGIALLYAGILYASGITTGSTRHIFDGLATAILAYMVIAFLRHAHHQSSNNRYFERDLLQKTEQLQVINESLRVADIRVRRLARVAEYAQDMVIIIGKTGEIEWVNRAFQDSTGYRQSEVIGQRPGFLNTPNTDPEVIETLVNAQMRGEYCRAEVLNKTKTGSERWIEVNQTPIFSDTGELECTVSVERDVSIAKEREAALAAARAEAERTADAKTAFLATMSHEIRTPMNGVLGMADLLSSSDLDDEQKLLVDTIQESGNALLAIINDILDYTKLESGKAETAKEPFSPEICAQRSADLIRPLAEKKGIGFEVISELEPSLMALGDDGRVRQILLNLLGNAVKFTSAGSVQLRLRTLSDGRTEFAVSDSGIGIPRDRLQAIFDAFSQADGSTSRRFGGTGLGLSISQKLARVMGGHITVSSDIGVGSTFALQLPLERCSEARAQQRDQRNLTNAEHLNGWRVLVAEDNRTNRLLIEKYLKPTGLELHFAEDGEHAISQYQSLKPDLMLMDVSMPKKDGLEATRAIREWELDAERDACPIIALTANAFEEDKKACLAAGMTGFLTKPVSRAKVLSEISQVLSKQVA